MPTRKASAEWKGTLENGKGALEVESGALKGAYSAASRFSDGRGTNPEELIGAAHAGCFSMALAGALNQAGHEPKSIRTSARVTIEKTGEGFAIKRIHLDCEGEVPGIDEATFRDKAKEAKVNCPVSRALAAGVDIGLEARLVR